MPKFQLPIVFDVDIIYLTISAFFPRYKYCDACCSSPSHCSDTEDQYIKRRSAEILTPRLWNELTYQIWIRRDA